MGYTLKKDVAGLYAGDWLENGTDVYYTSSGKVYKSTDGGLTFAPSYSSPNNAIIPRIFKVNGSVFVLGSLGGSATQLLKNTAGNTWTSIVTFHQVVSIGHLKTVGTYAYFCIYGVSNGSNNYMVRFDGTTITYIRNNPVNNGFTAYNTRCFDVDGSGNVYMYEKLSAAGNFTSKFTKWNSTTLAITTLRTDSTAQRLKMFILGSVVYTIEYLPLAPVDNIYFYFVKYDIATFATRTVINNNTIKYLVNSSVVESPGLSLSGNEMDEFGGSLFLKIGELAGGALANNVTYQYDPVANTLVEFARFNADVTIRYYWGYFSRTATELILGKTSQFLSVFIAPPPDPEPVIGTYFEVPMLNSLHIIKKAAINNVTVMQTLDNALLVDQYFPGFSRTNYFQKVCKQDTPVIQFNSDYPTFTSVLKDYCTDEVVKSYTCTLKEQNINVTEDYALTIRDHNIVGYSRVYFNSGTPPIPVSSGQEFTIINNADAFNGVQTIDAIETDTLLGVQYLLIAVDYTLLASYSPATGRFSVSTVGYNVYETNLNFTGLPDGKYYLEITATDDVKSEVATSEPISLKAVHKDTCLIVYRNTDNAYDITWTTGYVGQIRVEAVLFKRLPGGERTTSRDSDYSLVKTSSKKSRIVRFETYMLPPYLHEKLSVLMDLDFFSVNTKGYQSSEGYGEPEYLDRFKLANSSIKLEQLNWFVRYNSNDITQSSGGFLIDELEDLIKLK